MPGHLTSEAMNGYARRSLPPGDLLSADDHLEACAACRERISDDEGLKEAIRSLQQALLQGADPEERHLSYEQLETHAEGILGRADREIINSHLATCDLCAAEARDFAAFARAARAAIGAPIGAGPISLAAAAGRKAAAPQRRAAPEAIAPPEPPAEPPAAAPAKTIGDEEAAPAQVTPPRSRGPGLLVTLGAALAAAVAAAWLVPSALRRQIGDLQAEIEALRRDNEALALQAEEAESLRDEMEELRSTTAAPLPAGPGTEAPDPGLPSAAVTLADRRGPVGLDANGDLIGLDALPVAAGRMIAAVLRTGRAGTPPELPDLFETPPEVADEAAGGEGARLLAPVATIVRETRPTFSWRAQPGAAGYIVAVHDAGFNGVARSESLTRTSWRPGRPLKRGGLYVWQVFVRRGEEEFPSASQTSQGARFKVLGTKESAALDRSLRDAGESHLAAGVLLARAGCVGDARKEFQELLKRNPESPLARNLLESVGAGLVGAVPDEAAR